MECGAYTPFSSFEYKTLKLIEAGRVSIATLNVILSLAVGFIAVALGCPAGRRFSLTLEVAERRGRSLAVTPFPD